MCKASVNAGISQFMFSVIWSDCGASMSFFKKRKARSQHWKEYMSHMGGGILATLKNLCLSLWPWTLGHPYPPTHQWSVHAKRLSSLFGGKDGVSLIAWFSSVEPGTAAMLSNTDCWGNGFVVKLLTFPSHRLYAYLYSPFSWLLITFD